MLTAAGIGSGLDIESLVSQLVSAEITPASTRLTTKEAKLTASLSAFGSLKSALSTFQDAVSDMKNADNLLSRKASSSNKDLFTVSATTQAVAGSYAIEVNQLAEAAKATTVDGDFSASTDVVGTGTLNISLGSDSFSLSITNGNNSLANIRDAINNAEDNPGVTATIISTDAGTNLVLSSKDVGSSNSITVTATDDDAGDGNDLARLNALEANPNSVAAKDAIIYVDSQIVTRSSNVFSDVIDGVTFTLQAAEPGTTETLTVSADSSALRSKVDSFISAYNSLADTFGNLSSYDADTGVAGQLQGDSTLRSVESQIRQAINTAVAGLDNGTLASLGITTNDSNNLVLDETRFNEVVNADFEAVSDLFASESGLAQALDTVIEQYIGTSGVITFRTEGIDSRLDEIEDEKEKISLRIESLEARYLAQFTAMDALVGQLQSLGTYLGQQLANLPEPNSIGRN